MKAERIKTICFEAASDAVGECSTCKAIQQATREERVATIEEVAGWLDEKGRNYGDNGFVDVASFFHYVAIELRQRENSDTET